MPAGWEQPASHELSPAQRLNDGTTALDPRRRRLITTSSSDERTATAPGDAVAAVFAAVADPNRLRLLLLLLDGERCVTQCVEHTGLVQSLVSKHLAKLVDAGLVQRRRSGRHNCHGVADPEGVREILDAAERLAQARRTD